MTEPHVLIISTSLNPNSQSLVLAQEAQSKLDALGISNRLISLRELDLPFCDGTDLPDSHTGVQRLRAAGKLATHFIISMPIYNGDVNGAARNLVNLGCSFGGKTVGFLCAAGGQRSYMAPFSIGNSLMFEYECWIVPRYVYAEGRDLAGGKVSNPEISKRIDRMLAQLLSRELSGLAVA